MDQAVSTSLLQAGFSTGGIGLAYVTYRLLKAMCGKRLVSDCCTHRFSVGMRIEESVATPDMISSPLLFGEHDSAAIEVHSMI